MKNCNAFGKWTKRKLALGVRDHGGLLTGGYLFTYPHHVKPLKIQGGICFPRGMSGLYLQS
jgi:hypothetical protein